MSPLRRFNLPKRNDRCPCQSGKKFKRCCGAPVEIARPLLNTNGHSPAYIDYGEEAIRWLIVDSSGTKIFSDIENHAIVFQKREDAFAVTQLEDFADQDPGEINVAGVGPTKWQMLQNKISFVEVLDADTAIKLVRERITQRRHDLDDATDAPEEETET